LLRDEFTDTRNHNSDPDIYRFRTAALPGNLMLPPHSENASPIPLTLGQTGDLAEGIS
jgi:hypothetical protein